MCGYEVSVTRSTVSDSRSTFYRKYGISMVEWLDDYDK